MARWGLGAERVMAFTFRGGEGDFVCCKWGYNYWSTLTRYVWWPL